MRWTQSNISKYIDRESDVFPEDYSWTFMYVELKDLISGTGEIVTLDDWRKNIKRYDKDYIKRQEKWYTSPGVAERFPIVVVYGWDGKLHVIGGMHRTSIAAKNGWKKIPAFIGRFMDDRKDNLKKSKSGKMKIGKKGRY